MLNTQTTFLERILQAHSLAARIDEEVMNDRGLDTENGARLDNVQLLRNVHIEILQKEQSGNSRMIPLRRKDQVDEILFK